MVSAKVFLGFLSILPDRGREFSLISYLLGAGMNFLILRTSSMQLSLWGGLSPGGDFLSLGWQYCRGIWYLKASHSQFLLVISQMSLGVMASSRSRWSSILFRILQIEYWDCRDEAFEEDAPVTWRWHAQTGMGPISTGRCLLANKRVCVWCVGVPFYNNRNQMGSDESKQAERQKFKFQQMFTKNFVLYEQKIDEIFGQVSLFKNKNTDKTEVLVKNVACAEEAELQRIIESMQARIIHPIPNLLSIYHLQVINVTNAFCGSVLSLKVYVEYLEKSLKEQLRKRRKIKNYCFSEQQLWKILISLANAVKHLHDIHIFHGEIRLENILIDGDYQMKLVEKSLLNPLNWQIEMGKENVKLIKGKGVLFSPCILKCLYHQKTQINSYDPFKADIYAIGMIMLECASLQKAEDFYDYQKFYVKQKEIQYTIYELRKKYSYGLMNLIEKMLEDEDEERPSAAELYEKIQKIPDENIRELNMSLNESFMNESIRSYM